MQSETIRQLYNGTLVPSEWPLPDTVENASLSAEIKERLNALNNRLNDEDKAALGAARSIGGFFDDFKCLLKNHDAAALFCAKQTDTL